MRVLGRFPAQSTDAVIGLVYVLDGVARWEDTDASGPLVIGLDVARFGDDETVAVARRGYKVLAIERLPPADGPDTASRFVLWLQGSKLLRAGEKPVVNVDAIGVGASVFDALARSRAVDARAVNSGSASTKPNEFTNLRAELHFAGRDWLREGGALPGTQSARSRPAGTTTVPPALVRPTRSPPGSSVTAASVGTSA